MCVKQLLTNQSDVFRLKPLDVAFMKAVDSKVNIVPIIAKADTLTRSELAVLKQRVSWSALFIVGGCSVAGLNGSPAVLCNFQSVVLWSGVSMVSSLWSTVCGLWAYGLWLHGPWHKAFWSYCLQLYGPPSTVGWSMVSMLFGLVLWSLIWTIWSW